MDFYKEQLLKFRDLNLSKKELMDTVPKDFEAYEPILVCNSHVIYLLESYKNNNIVESFLLDWVNTIWFTDWYTYYDENSDCIAGIMTELEEIDEEGHELNSDKIQKYIFALQNNVEI